MRRYEFTGGSSEKFWEIEQAGTTVTVRYGRLGTAGRASRCIVVRASSFTTRTPSSCTTRTPLS
ncbi:WGR domain-containing protein [Gordonia oleivorans]|uniref:WGR domain-containing protein n=1 Tax=Gordonia oleivorans TaxID=3156618 RepID=UPI003CCDFD7C